MSIISPKLLGLFILSALTPLLSYSASASETKEWRVSGFFRWAGKDVKSIVLPV